MRSACSSAVISLACLLSVACGRSPDRPDEPDAPPAEPSAGGDAPSSAAGAAPADAPASADRAASADSDPDAPDGTPCAPPVTKHYAASARTIGCATGGDTILFDVAPAAVGRAVARLTLGVSSSGAGGVAYVWSGNVAVGAPAVANALGGDVVPGGTLAPASVLGSGTLAAAGRVRAVVRVSPLGTLLCDDAAITALAPALDVWIEDGRPACAGKDLVVASWARAHGATSFDWPTTYSDLVAVDVPPAADRSRVRVLSSVEATPLANPSQGFFDASELVLTRTLLDGASAGVDQRGTPGITGGMTHVVLSTDVDLAQPLAQSRHVAMQVAKNYTFSSVVTSAQFGDGVLAVIREP